MQQSDIDGAANSLEQANTPNPQQMIQPLIHPNEHLVGTPKCTPNVTHDHNAGDHANSVTVSVNFTCTGEVYDYDGASAIAAQLLKNRAMTDLGSSYALVGNIDTNVISATLTNAGQGIVAVLVSAAGRWVYQFSPAQQQQLAQLIAGKSKQTALALLTSQPGVGNAGIQLQGSGNTLPTDPSLISIVIQPGS